jgi:hypothetical protein
MSIAVQGLIEGLGFAPASTQWLEVRDGHPVVWALARGHYSAAKNSRPKIRQCVGPGEKLVLLHRTGLAAFAWRRFIDDSGQQGLNNALFVNHGAGLSSQLILEAERVAWTRWPGERLYTYVDPRKVKSPNPGYCYLCAGWRRWGWTKGGLLVLEKEAENNGG